MQQQQSDREEDRFLNFAYAQPKPAIVQKVEQKRIYTREEQLFLDSYMDMVNSIWYEWFATKGSPGSMSMTEREEQLKYYRDRLRELRK